MIGSEKIADIVEKIITGYDPDKIILFGSYATGKPTEDSDLDLLVIKASELPRPLRTVFVRKLLYGAMVPIDLIVYTPDEIAELQDNKYSFVFEVLSAGKTLYERVN